MKIVTNIDLSKNQLQNAVGHVLASAPSSPTEGQLYYDSVLHAEYIYNGSAWRPTDAAKLADGSIALTALNNLYGSRLDQFAAPTADLSINSHKLTNVVDPASAQDAATKNYVDVAMQSAAAGIDAKPSVRAVATSSLTLSGTQTVDGVALIAGDAVLCTAQTTGSQNGVYIVASGAWTRRTQEDATGEITPGAQWYVEEGTTYGKTQWRVSNTGTITLGTTSITIVQSGAAQLISADGTTLTMTGQVLSAILGYGLITSSGIAIDRTKIPSKFAGTITGDSSTTAFTITHNLASTDVVVMLKDSSGNQVLADINTATSNTITVTFATAPTTGVTYRAIVVG